MEEKQKPIRWEVWSAAGLVLFVIYALSCGPVAWILESGKHYDLMDVAGYFYWPLWKTVGLCPPLSDALLEYKHSWDGGPYYL